uniref:Ig-like domain-containing protein n=1 Tax=Oreochromis niloticus TaxID=8128 RepID=A0A669CWN1_ORENI
MNNSTITWYSPKSTFFIFLFCFLKLMFSESGEDVTLTCRAPNNNIIVVKWSRADLGDEYVLLYRDDQFVPDEQHPSFKNRVDLQDRQMKDGDVSLILKNVTINDAGTYECRTNRRKRAILETEPICIIKLSVSDPSGESLEFSVSVITHLTADTHACFSPAGPPGGRERFRHIGLIAALLLFNSSMLLLGVVFFIHRRRKQQQTHGSQKPPGVSDSPAADISVETERIYTT